MPSLISLPPFRVSVLYLMAKPALAYILKCSVLCLFIASSLLKRGIPLTLFLFLPIPCVAWYQCGLTYLLTEWTCQRPRWGGNWFIRGPTPPREKITKMITCGSCLKSPALCSFLKISCIYSIFFSSFFLEILHIFLCPYRKLPNIDESHFKIKLNFPDSPYGSLNWITVFISVFN